MTLKPGMTVTIEPWFQAGAADVSRAAHVELTIAVTDNGPLVLTTP